MMKISNRRFKPSACLAALLLTLFSLTSCHKTETQADPADAKHYPLKGKVVSVDKAAKKAKIEHDEIPGFMEAMTMDFTIREDWVWTELTPGSEVRANLVVTKDGYWLEKIGIVAAPNPNQAALPVNENFVQIGKEPPNFTLTNQDGKRISLQDYRGKALAITFIYRECPLREYCIKMSQNFSDLAMRLQNDPETRDKFRLLSVSFDPARDTPAELRKYGIGYMGNDPKTDFTVWQLAVGTDREVRRMADFFGLQYKTNEKDKTQIDHSLRTAVISPSGKVTKIFAGNEWTPDDLGRALKAAYTSDAEPAKS